MPITGFSRPIPLHLPGDPEMTAAEYYKHPYHIDWCYPTSSGAAKFKFSKTGCWAVLDNRLSPKPPKMVGGFATKEEAQGHYTELMKSHERNA